MAEIKQEIDCTYCGHKNGVKVITKQTQHSRSVKVKKCKKCRRQPGVLRTLKRF